MRRFAEDTQVPVSRSRGEIDKILRAWGATGVAWADEFELGMASLHFKWRRESDGMVFAAKLSIRLPTDAQLREKARHARSGDFLPSKFDSLCDARGRREHRVLVLWLKAAFNAIDVGIIDAEQLFLPFMVGGDGRTVAEVALPAIGGLLAPGGMRLLGDGGSHG